ncbi:hypothetical protein VPH35_009455 [Triticum aestivum]
MARLDQVHSKVNLFVSSPGEIHQDQVHVARVLKESSSARDANIGSMAAPPRRGVSPFCCPAAVAHASGSTSKEQHRPPPPVDPGKVPPTPQYSSSFDEHGSKRPWMPKIEFPRFDGVRIWLDNCEAYFQLYQIPDNFMVMSASLHLYGNAAHWYQAYKLYDYCSSWSQFASAILLEFDRNMHRNCMRELLVTETGWFSSGMSQQPQPIGVPSATV